MAQSFEIVERVGVSSVSISDAVKLAVFGAGRERPVAWFEVIRQQGRVTENGELEYQVTVKMGRKLS
ncbi:MAG: dodecin domain-containing protein [Acidobacteria bacterium]|nr:dodecin domain-containing protein [Acidobacteriota bacterium]